MNFERQEDSAHHLHSLNQKTATKSETHDKNNNGRENQQKNVLDQMTYITHNTF